MLDTFHDHRRAYAFFSNLSACKPTPCGPKASEWDFSFDTVLNSRGQTH